MKSWLKIVTIVFIILIVLIIFLYPKLSYTSRIRGDGINNKKCMCLGFEWAPLASLPEEHNKFCLGFSVFCKCYRNTILNRTTRTFSTEEIECSLLGFG